MAAPMIKLFGSNLASGTETVTTAAALKGKTVGIYFSAHWCPPCRGFTPKLAERYKELKAKGEAFEIVFVSSDRDDEAFKEYFASMPWLALPFADRDTKAALSKKFKVNGIPSLILLDADSGEVINKEGRAVIMDEPETWKPPTLFEALSGDLTTRDGTKPFSELREQAEVIALYFSAHWCPPCRGFTPKFGETYKKLEAAGKKFAVIFVSSDRDEEGFKEYFESMPSTWLAIPPGDKRKGQLDTIFEVQGIPTLVLIDASTGATINANARGMVSSDPDGAAFPWHPPAVADLSEPEGINETASLCVMAEGCSGAEREAMMSVLTPIAKEAKATEEDEMIFFMASAAEGVPQQVRKLTKLGDAGATPQMIILNIPDNGGFYTCTASEVTDASVRDFIRAFKDGSLERQQLDK